MRNLKLIAFVALVGYGSSALAMIKTRTSQEKQALLQRLEATKAKSEEGSRVRKDCKHYSDAIHKATKHYEAVQDEENLPPSKQTSHFISAQDKLNREYELLEDFLDNLDKDYTEKDYKKRSRT